MTEQEKAELNRRVAVAMGATVEWREPQFSNNKGWVLRQVAKPVPGLEHRTGPFPCWQEDGLYGHEEFAWSKVHNFVGDARAADLVRQEIERRGWVWSIGPWEGKQYSSWVTGGTARCATAPHGLGESDSPWEALCLAFLAAVDAEKEQRP